MEIPKELRYAKSHEWIRQDGDKITLGITAFAVEQLGDITLVELPELGKEVKADETFGTIESVKSVSDLYAPVGGKVSKINERLEEEPELVNEAPYGDGWMVELERTDAAEVGALLDHAAYEALVAEES